MRDSITLSVYYGAELDLGELRRRRTVAVRPRRRTSSSTSSGRGRGVRSRSRSRTSPTAGLAHGGGADAAARGRARAGRCGVEDLLNTLAGLVLLAGHGARARRRDRRRPAHGWRSSSTASLDPLERAVTTSRIAVRLRGPDVRDRPRDRVRDRPGGRLEADGDVPCRGRAADRNRSRARADRRARPTVSRLDDRFSRREPADRGRCAEPIARGRRDGRGERQRRGRDRRRCLRAAGARSRRTLLSPLLSVVPGSSSPGRSHVRRASTRTIRTGSARSHAHAERRAAFAPAVRLSPQIEVARSGVDAQREI